MLDLPHSPEQIFIVLRSLGIGVHLRGSGFDGRNVFGREAVIAGASQNEVLIPMIGDEARVNMRRLGDVNTKK